jgi:hypothetical protein
MVNIELSGASVLFVFEGVSTVHADLKKKITDSYLDQLPSRDLMNPARATLVVFAP